MAPIVLYTFGGSVWAAAPELAVRELGYTSSAVEKKVVNLVEGENFAPSFLKLNPKATLPTLEADGKVLTNTTDVVSYLVQHAPTPSKAGNSSFIAEIHEDQYDPNFALLLTRNDEELKAKAASIPGFFAQHRQNALEKYSVTPEANEFADFYKEKLAFNGGLLHIYKGEVPEEVKLGFFEKSKGHWVALRKYISEILPSYLPSSGFIAGDKPGEDDFHAGAWLARIAATTGAAKSDDALKGLERELGTSVPPKVVSYWNAWSARESFKEVYADGLH